MKKTISFIRVAVLHLLFMASVVCLIATPASDDHFLLIAFGSKILAIILLAVTFILIRLWRNDQLIKKIDSLCQE